MELKPEDLMLNCGMCEGKGEISNPKLSKGDGGFGMRVVGPLTVTCEKCHGKGVLLTESGKTLVAFVQRAKSKGFLY